MQSFVKISSKSQSKACLIYIIPLFVLIFSILIPNTVQAQSDELIIEQFYVSVKPEYDNPKTLVIYQADFVNSGSEIIIKDTPVSFIIPKPKKPQDLEIVMACEINSSGGHLCQPYVTKEIGDGKVAIDWNITKDIEPGGTYTAYLEFYYDNYSTPPDKSFTYLFYPTYTIDNLDLRITTPKTADFATNPSAQRTEVDGQGLQKHIYDYTNLTPDHAVDLKISYTKDDNKPTYKTSQVNNQTASSDSTPDSEKSWLTKPAVAIPTILGVGAFAFLLGFILRKGKHK